MDSPVAFEVARVAWSEAHDVLRAIRTAVFIDEQSVPQALEWDGVDADCVQVLARAADGTPVGTGRLLPDGHIGRMAVLKPWRGQGVGTAMLHELLAAARDRGHATAELSAQTHAIGFYRRFGFEVTGEEYLEAGILHRAMRLVLKPR